MLTPLLCGILAPAVLSGIAFGGVWRLWNRSALPLAGGTCAGALACYLGIVAGYIGLWGWPGFPPLLAEGWLPFLGLAALGVSVLESLVFKSCRARTVLWLVLVFASVWVLTGSRRSTWKGAEIPAWSIGLTAGILCAGSSLELIAERRGGASVPVALWVWLAGMAGALAATGSIRYGQIAGILAAVMGAGTVAAWIQPRISFARGTITALMPLAGGLLICGYFYSDLPGSCALILAAAPAILWLGETNFVKGRKPWVGVLIRAALIALPVAAALLIAVWPMLFAKPSPAGPPGQGNDYY